MTNEIIYDACFSEDNYQRHLQSQAGQKRLLQAQNDPIAPSLIPSCSPLPKA